AYSGGQYRFVVMMQQTPVYNAIHGQPDTFSTFTRARGRPGPHDVMVAARTVVGQHSSLPAPSQAWAYALSPSLSSAVKEGSPASVANYRFSGVYSGRWTYDVEGERYLRTQNGVKDVDTSGNQLTATNIVVARVNVTMGYG